MRTALSSTGTLVSLVRWPPFNHSDSWRSRMRRSSPALVEKISPPESLTTLVICSRFICPRGPTNSRKSSDPGAPLGHLQPLHPPARPREQPEIQRPRRPAPAVDVVVGAPFVGRPRVGAVLPQRLGELGGPQQLGALVGGHGQKLGLALVAGDG